jgi:hypothetical protein
MAEFTVREGDVLEAASDLLLLKYAQGFYGADRAAALRLASAAVCAQAELQPRPGDFVVMETRGSMAPKRVMFLGTPPLRSFTYNQMEIFARRAIEKIADLGLPVRVLTTTVHGTGYGLDGGEALQRLVRGFREGILAHKLNDLERITFLTLDDRTERMLGAALRAIATRADATALSTGPADTPAVAEGVYAADDTVTRTATLTKKRVFVALPFSEEFENVYEFGIYPAVRNCGFICERVDQAHFTGDILNRIKGSIEAAEFVIADLTEGRPNVYLEVGYAWGKGVPVIFVAKKDEKLHFDVSTHRCIFYGKFSKLAKDLEDLLRGIESARV